MKENRMSEEFKERLFHGCFLGLVLFASAVMVLCLRKNTAEIERILPYAPIALVGYLVIGFLLICIHDRPESGWFSSWFKGSAAVYWCSLFAFAISIIGIFVSEIIRYILLVNVAIAVGCWIIDYCWLQRTADELNQGAGKGRYLIVDLQDCPKGTDAFCREIEDYCKKSRIRLEFINWGRPADVMMDGEKYHVELDSFYSQFGPMYALKFKKLS